MLILLWETEFEIKFEMLKLKLLLFVCFDFMSKSFRSFESSFVLLILLLLLLLFEYKIFELLIIFAKFVVFVSNNDEMFIGLFWICLQTLNYMYCYLICYF